MLCRLTVPVYCMSIVFRCIKNCCNDVKLVLYILPYWTAMFYLQRQHRPHRHLYQISVAYMCIYVYIYICQSKRSLEQKVWHNENIGGRKAALLPVPQFTFVSLLTNGQQKGKNRAKCLASSWATAPKKIRYIYIYIVVCSVKEGPSFDMPLRPYRKVFRRTRRREAIGVAEITLVVQLSIF